MNTRNELPCERRVLPKKRELQIISIQTQQQYQIHQRIHSIPSPATHKAQHTHSQEIDFWFTQSFLVYCLFDRWPRAPGSPTPSLIYPMLKKTRGQIGHKARETMVVRKVRTR